MTCRPECNPACDAGMACDYSASPPECILPDPQNFTLFISMSERFQTPMLYEYDEAYVGGWEYIGE